MPAITSADPDGPATMSATIGVTSAAIITAPDVLTAALITASFATAPLAIPAPYTPPSSSYTVTSQCRNARILTSKILPLEHIWQGNAWRYIFVQKRKHFFFPGNVHGD
ncbi:hypothetical protein E2C01_033832 [Portunus trituberculatus]|uniref:Uncharacterized protein n=1 Tax=Portunus trituberculatus TaxID=210409 RepID=A0A5B7F400_PORTR|nr:hypothetical protein [Portunus trituberculatus]